MRKRVFNLAQYVAPAVLGVLAAVLWQMSGTSPVTHDALQPLTAMETRNKAQSSRTSVAPSGRVNAPSEAPGASASTFGVSGDGPDAPAADATVRSEEDDLRRALDEAGMPQAEIDLALEALLPAQQPAAMVGDDILPQHADPSGVAYGGHHHSVDELALSLATQESAELTPLDLSEIDLLVSGVLPDANESPVDPFLEKDELVQDLLESGGQSSNVDEIVSAILPGAPENDG